MTSKSPPKQPKKVEALKHDEATRKNISMAEYQSVMAEEKEKNPVQVAYERKLLESVELGEWQSVVNLPEEIAKYQQYAQSQINALEPVSIELPINDLQTLRTIAQQADTSVALLMASILHQYVASQSSPQS
ncbi:MAG: hypothetical protein HLUCCA11_20485 [Phormidesmis priestleyi Ana]|uniref:Uncharacterized protein n=1 Tax=Phormidesmis priestleyi Ana TaxID=1666911 RepID=A0A0N8KM58_9CYAN|nr:MAG: hypothetical protein HLUCCA11_20485 [Phormidesmis priestleyi Ana]